MAKPQEPRPATHRCGYIPWHVLIRQLGIDVETCSHCGGKMKIIALVSDPQSIARYLRHLAPPTRAAGAGPRLAELIEATRPAERDGVDRASGSDRSLRRADQALNPTLRHSPAMREGAAAGQGRSSRTRTIPMDSLTRTSLESAEAFAEVEQSGPPQATRT